MTEVLAHTAGYGGLHGWASQAGTAQLVRQNASSAARYQPATGFAVQLSPGTDQSLDSRLMLGGSPPRLFAWRRQEIELAMTTAMPPAATLHVVVGYDGSPLASRALDGAVRLMAARTGRIDVVYVAHLSSLAMLSPGAIAEVEEGFDEVEQELRAQATGQLSASGTAWQFERRQGIIADQLIAAATTLREAHPGEDVAIIVGSSSHATHRVVGSVAVGLARHSPVPLIIVP